MNNIIYLESAQAGANETNLSNNYFGVASTNVVSGEQVGVNRSGSFNNNQTGMTAGVDQYVTDAGLIKPRTTTTTVTDSNPTVSTVTTQDGSAYSNGGNSISYESTSGYYVRGRMEPSTNYPVVESGTWTSNSAGITWGTPTVLSSNNLRNYVAVTTGGGYSHVAYCTRENSNENAKVTPVAISGSGAITLGTTTTVFTKATTSSFTDAISVEYDTSSNTIISFFNDGSTANSSSIIVACPLQMNGANYSFNSSDNVNILNGIEVHPTTTITVFDPDTQRTIFFYTKNNSPTSINGIVISCTGTTISLGATQTASFNTKPNNAGFSTATYDTQNNKIVFVYEAVSPTNSAKYSIVTVTGGATNTLSYTADAYLFSNTSTKNETANITYDADANKLLYVYPDYFTYHFRCNTLTSNGSSLTSTQDVEISSEEWRENTPDNTSSIYVNNKGVAYSFGGRDGSYQIVNFTQFFNTVSTTVVNGSQFVGTARSGTDLELSEPPVELVGMANGSITKGKPVILRTDEDFEQVKETSLTVTTTQTIGAETTLNTSGRDYYSTAHNNNGTFIIVYRPDSPDKVNARLGTYASNGTITWGTNIVLTKPSVATIQSVSCYYDPDNDCFVALGGTGTNQYVYATILTYSGVTLTEGNYVEFDPNGSNTNGTSYISAQYDTVNNIGYASCSAYGDSVTTLTVSGTTITAGSRQYVFGSYTSTMQYLSLNYDSANNRGTMYYRDVSNSYYASAVAFTSSGGTLTFGTKVVLDSSGSGSKGDCANSPTQTYIAYKNGDYIYYNNLTFSGAEITVGSKQTLTTAGSLDVGGGKLFLYNPDGKFYFVFTRSGSPKWLALAQGTVSGTTLNNNNIEIYNNLSSAYEYWVVGNTSISNPTMILAGKDTSNNYAEALTFVSTATVTTISSNLSTKFIGFAQNTVSDNEDVKVAIISQTDENQSGLTTASQYYVQDDGTLSTSPDNPSVLGGTALSSTKILIKS